MQIVATLLCTDNTQMAVIDRRTDISPLIYRRSIVFKQSGSITTKTAWFVLLEILYTEK